MKIINKIKDGTIIVCENDYKKKLLKEMTNQKLFLNIKFYSKKEFFNSYFFSYDEKTIVYLVKKYGWKPEVAKMYLSNLYCINNGKYESNKIKKLLEIKNELINNNLLKFDYHFKDIIKNNSILVWGYSYFENYELDVFNSLKAEFIKDDSIYHHNKVYEFNLLEDEIDFVAKEIAALLKDGIDINKIKIVNADEDYYTVIQRLFMLYNIPVKIPVENSLYSNLITQKFLDNLTSDINESIKVIENDDSQIVNKIISVCNKYVFEKDFLTIKKILISEFKNIKIDNYSLKNYVELLDYNYPFTDEYVFFINFNSGSIPTVIKDESYITDNIKTEVNLKKVKEINFENKEYLINKIKSIKNLTISYKLKSNKNDYFPSFIISQLNLEVIKYENNILKSYSLLNDKLKFAKMLDNYSKYGNLHSKYYIYQNSLGDIKYKTYSNKYKSIDKNLLKEYLKNKFVLSYTSLNNYNKCAFRYYLTNVLKLDKYEESFEAFIGLIFHDVLEKCLTQDLDIDSEVQKYIKEHNKVLTSKDLFFVKKVTKDMKEVIEIIKEQNKHNSLDNALYEKNISIDKSKDDFKIEFIGFIDKILFRNIGDKTLVSIIDYKTGFIDIELKYALYGLSLQLPIYLYLVKNSNIFNNPVFVGFYLQYILDKDILKLPNKSYESQKKDNLKLMGYSLNDPDYLEKFDDTYANSEVIKGLKIKADGSFASTSKVLSEDQINNLILITEQKVDEVVNNIIDANFEINPKKIGYFDDVGCKYCKFRDICYRKEEDYLLLEDKYNFDFLGGEEDA